MRSGEGDRIEEKVCCISVGSLSLKVQQPRTQDTANDYQIGQGAQRLLTPWTLQQGENSFLLRCCFCPTSYLPYSTFFLEREKDHLLTTVKRKLYFSQLPGGQWGSLGQSTMVWTAKLLLWSGAGGPAFSLTWQLKESLECWTEFTLKVTLQCRLPYLGEKTVRKNVLLLTSWPWQKVRKIHTKIASLVYILLYVPIWTYDSYGM